MCRGGGLVFTGMPRRREVLGTGIIRWAKVVNPDGSVTWQEAQSTESPDSKEGKNTKPEKQKLERPSWIDVKKESSNLRVSKRRATSTDVAEELKAKESRVEAQAPAKRAFSLRAEEKRTKREEDKTTDNVEEVHFAAAPIRKEPEKKGFVAGLATKFGSTTSKGVQTFSSPKKETEAQQPAAAARPLIERRNAEDLHSDKLKVKLPRVDTHAKAYQYSPQPEEQQQNTNTNNNLHRSRSSHWSTQSDPNTKQQQESDDELALRLANTEKIFRQQEQKIQAALDRIRDLERQLAATEQDDAQSKISSEENDSIAAGGRETGPYFRTSTTLGEEVTNSVTTKGPPLPAFFSACDDDDELEYRVLTGTVSSHKPK